MGAIPPTDQQTAPSSGRSVHVPVGTLSHILACLVAAGIAVPAIQVIGDSSIGGIAAGGIQFSSGFEVADNNCSTTLNGNGYIGGGGSGAPQNCDWHTSSAAQSTYTEPHIDDAMPHTGLQHLRLQYDPNQPTGDPDHAADPGVRNWAFSDPDLVPATDGVQHLSLWVRMGTPGGLNNLLIQPQQFSQGQLTTIMELRANGRIRVGDDKLCDDGEILLVPTGFSWVPNEYRRVDICIDNPNDRIRYFYGGELIYTAGCCGIFAGTAIEHVLFRFEVNADDGTVVDIDDVIIEVGNCPAGPSGACCVAAGICQFLDDEQCDSLGGIYLGDGVQCDTAICDATLLCEGATGDCFSGNGTIGCDQPDPGAFPLPSPSCCTLVCSQPGFEICCALQWLPSPCAELAASLCTVVNCSQPEQNCQQMDLVDINGPAESVTGITQVADNFAPASNGVANSVCWYGTYFATGEIPSDTFTITYYDCIEGVPGNVVAGPYVQGQSLSVTRIDTNLDLSPDDPIFEYTATHANTPLLTAGDPYFIEIVNTVGVVDPRQSWFWQSSNECGSDGQSFQKPDGEPYARHFRYGEDMTFCLNLALGDTSDLCPIPPPVPCQLDLANVDFVEPEACGQDPDPNMGCTGIDAGQLPGPFTDLPSISLDPSNPTVIAGQAWAESGARDVDWLRFIADSTPDLLGNQDGMIFVCLSALSEIPIGARVGTIPSARSCDDVPISEISAIGFECQSTLSTTTEIPTSSGDNDLGVIIVRTYDGVEVFNGYPCAPACSWDCELVPDGNVGINDFLALLGQWTRVGSSCDFDGGGVGIIDFLALLANWGPCSTLTEHGNDYLLNVSIVDDPSLCFPDSE